MINRRNTFIFIGIFLGNVVLLCVIFYFSYDYIYEKGFHDGAEWFKDKVLEYGFAEEYVCEDCQVS